MNFEALLEEFKQKEAPEDCLVLLAKEGEGDRLRRICSAWNKIRIERVVTKTIPGSTEYEKWDWLWENVDYDINSLQDITGIKGNIIDDMAVLIGNRIIYPDGTISSFATKILRTLMQAELGY